VPRSAGAAEARPPRRRNASQRGDPRSDTADFNDRVAGNLRVDYLLPSKGLRVCGGGVFWPAQRSRGAPRVGRPPPPSSDHRLVWLDVTSAELDAHRAVIRQPVSLRVLVVEDHAHERLLQTRLREIAAEQDVVDELAVLAVRGARRELRLP
jgi:hypothetical protein